MKKKKNDGDAPAANVYYFGAEQEEAVVKFIQSEDHIERNKIYNNHLKLPIDKMIESIIRTYKLYPKDMSFSDIHQDTLSFLMLKFNKFKPEKNKKSYSYFGTIIKRYLIGLVLRDQKVIKTMLSYEDVSSEIENREDLIYEMDVDDRKEKTVLFVQEITTKLKDLVVTEDLTDNEKKVGNAIVEILDNWEKLQSDEMKAGNKFNKNLMLLYIRNITGLTTKDIRNSKKVFETLYTGLKVDFFELD